MKTPHHLARQSLYAALLILISQTVFAQNIDKAGPIKASFSAEQVSPSTYVIHGPLASPNAENQGFMNNPAFIVGDAGVIVVDAGGTVQVGEMVLKIIKQTSDLPVVATFSTHIHGDHWLGNQAIAEAYPDAKHYAHANLIEQANAGEGDSWVSLVRELTEGASAGTIYHSPDEAVQEGNKISIEGITLSIYHDDIAHTDTDIALLYEEEHVLFLGDTVMHKRLGRLDDGNFKGLITFLDRMLTINAEVYVPGHGQTGNREVVEKYKRTIEIILSTVEQEYENGLADFEIKPIVENKIGEIDQWSDIAGALGKLVSLAYLEVEEDAF